MISHTNAFVWIEEKLSESTQHQEGFDWKTKAPAYGKATELTNCIEPGLQYSFHCQKRRCILRLSQFLVRRKLVSKSFEFASYLRQGYEYSDGNPTVIFATWSYRPFCVVEGCRSSSQRAVNAGKDAICCTAMSPVHPLSGYGFPTRKSKETIQIRVHHVPATAEKLNHPSTTHGD